MRIAISGTACQGKSTLIKDFLEQWPNYTTLDKSYRDVITEQGLDHSSSTNKDTQWAILNFMIDEFQKTDKDKNIIFDRCPLDNIVYSIWAEAKKESDVDEEFIKKCMPLVRESLRFIDIIFFTPITKVAQVELEEGDLRDTDKKYIEEIDNIFKAVHRDYMNNQKSTFFVEDDRPAIIEVFGNRKERIELIKLYLDNDGDFIEPGSIISPEEIEEMEKMKKAFRLE
jgi:nicotinamide riboside kinase